MKKKLFKTLTAATLMLMSIPGFAQAPSLGTAANFVLFSSIGAVGNTGISQLTGNVGTNNGSITGFGNVNGVMHNSNGASAQCAADLLSVYRVLNNAIPTYFPAPLIGNGDTLIPGVYAYAGASTLSGNLILNAQGNPNAVFILKMSGPLSATANAKVKLVKGALACNVYWKVEGLISVSTGVFMRGTVIANNAAINMSANDTLEGRALSTTGAVNVSGLLAYTPTGCNSPYLTGPMAPALGTTQCYALFSTDGTVTNAGVTHLSGDVGTNVGLTTGFNALDVTGAIHPIPDASTAQCAADLNNVYLYLNVLPYDIQLLYPAQFGNNLVLTPHTYLMNAAAVLTGNLYLNAEGNANAVFVIQINGALSTSTYANVLLMNGTQPKNVYWVVNGAVNINDYSVFTGTVVCNNGAVSLNTGVTLNGKALTTTGALSSSAITVTIPPGCYKYLAANITTQPVSQSVCPGNSVSFSVAAIGGTLTYQWRKGTVKLINGGRISGATSSKLIITNANISDTSSHYNVIVSDSIQPKDTSAYASLKVTIAPIVISTPAQTVVCAGGSVNLSAIASSHPVYQWQYTTTGQSTVDSLWHNFGTNSDSATLLNVIQRTYARVVLTETGCATTSSRITTINVDSTQLGIAVSNVTSNSALLSWNAITGASYSIDVNGSTYVTDTNVFRVTGLSGCNSYFASIVALNAVCGGVPFGSATIVTSPQSLALALTAGTGGAIVATWTAGKGPYKLYYGLQVAQQNMVVVNVTGTTYTLPVKGMIPGTSYIAYVVDEGSTCTPIAQSMYAYYKTIGGSCVNAAPVIVSATSIANSFTINWTGSASAYKVYYKTSSGTWTSYAVSGNSYTLKGVMPGVCYPFFVANICGTTFGYSSIIDTICTGNICTQPLNIELSRATCNGFTATWNTIAGAATYEVYLTVASPSGSPVIYNYLVTGSPYTASIFGRGVPISVYVQSNCIGGGRSVSSNVQSITTLSTGCKDGDDINPQTNVAANTKSFAIYPNPNTGTFKVVMNTTATDATGTLEVMDVLGRVLYSKEVTNSNGTLYETVDMGNTVPSGLYMVRVRCGNDTHVSKVQVQK